MGIVLGCRVSQLMSFYLPSLCTLLVQAGERTTNCGWSALKGPSNKPVIELFILTLLIFYWALYFNAWIIHYKGNSFNAFVLYVLLSFPYSVLMRMNRLLYIYSYYCILTLFTCWGIHLAMFLLYKKRYI